MTDYDAFTYEVDRGAALITITKPESLNSLTRDEVGELIDALHAAEADGRTARGPAQDHGVLVGADVLRVAVLDRARVDARPK